MNDLAEGTEPMLRYDASELGRTAQPPITLPRLPPPGSRRPVRATPLRLGINVAPPRLPPLSPPRPSTPPIIPPAALWVAPPLPISPPAPARPPVPAPSAPPPAPSRGPDIEAFAAWLADDTIDEVADTAIAFDRCESPPLHAVPRMWRWRHVFTLALLVATVIAVAIVLATR